MDGRRPEPSYYAVLGVRPDATADEIRRAYRKLAMKWHPDRWRRQSDRLLDEANRKFQSIHEAYQVLSDRSKRTLYDAGMYDDEEEEEEVEGFADFVEEMVQLMADLRREEGVCGLPELRSMLDDMLRSFQPPPPAAATAARWADGCVGGPDSRGSKRVRTGETGFSRVGTGSYPPHQVASGLDLFGSASCC